MPMKDKERIFVSGSRGMVGSAIVRSLEEKGYSNLLTPSRSELDLTDLNKVSAFFKDEKPTQVYLAAAKVGGIEANNSFPAEFLYDNLMIESNLIHQAWSSGVKKLLFLGSSCIYPKFSSQPIKEEYLLKGGLEPTNEPYAIAKIAGIKLCESFNRQYGKTDGIDYRSLMPTNLYGVGDNYHPTNSHVIPGLIRRFHDATETESKSVTVWGTGKPKREFLFVDDLARACVFFMNLEKNKYDSCVEPMLSHVNVGSGSDISIKDLSYLISEITGFKGSINFDSSKPDGTPRKLLDSSKINALGWEPLVSLSEGLEIAFKDFKENKDRYKQLKKND